MMSELQMTRRRALYLAGGLVAVGYSSREADAKPTGDRGAKMTSIAESWERIHAWLGIHAPKILDNLNRPATDHQLHQAEKSFGCEMPEEWRELYRVHNGMNSDSNLGSLFCGMQFLTLEEAIREHENNSASDETTRPVRAADAGVRKEDIYNAKWIAFAHDGGETLLRIDLAPGPSGSNGQVIFTDHADDTVILLSNSLADLMSEFVRDLETGRYFLSQEALAEGDQFLVCEPENDVINWSHSPRWKHLAK